MTFHSSYDRSAQPRPREFYADQFGGRLPRESSSGWASFVCCFHQSHGDGSKRRSKSLRINLRVGNFVCMSCGVKGPDVLAFLMSRDGLDFKRAAQSLGCWRDGGLSPADKARIERDRRDREAKWARIEALEAANRRERISIRDTLHALEKLEREASRDLTRLHEVPDGSPEKESAWEYLAALCEPIREAEATYQRLTGI